MAGRTTQLDLGANIGLPPTDSPAPDPAGKRERLRVRELWGRDAPGYPLDNRPEQARHYTGVAYLCIRAIIEGLSGATFRVTQRRPPKLTLAASPDATTYKALPTPHAQDQDEEWEPADSGHPLCELFEHVNETDTPADFLADWTLQEELHGECYIWTPVLDQLGNPSELWVIPPALTTPMTGPSLQYPRGGVWAYTGGAGYLGQLAASRVPIGREELLWPRNRHPLYRWAAYSPYTAGSEQLDVLNSIGEAWKAGMDSGFMADTFVALKGATDQEITRFHDKLNERHGGARNFRRAAVANADEVSIAGTGSPVKDLGLGDGWDRMVSFASGLWQTTSGILGLTEADSYAAFFARLKQWHTMALRPRAARKAAYMTKHLCVPRYGREYAVQIDLPKIDDHERQNAEIDSDARNNAITVNEIRRTRNRKPVEGGDVPPTAYGQTFQPQPQLGQGAGAVAGNPADPDLQKRSTDPTLGNPMVAPGPTAGAPPRPSNPDGSGTLPPRPERKALGSPEYSDPAPYGYCPECRTPGLMAERRPGGKAKCGGGHEYPLATAKYASTQIELTGPARRKLLALAAQVKDADLGEGGREGEPHVTVRYGLHTASPAPVADAVTGFGDVSYTVGRLAAFRGAESGRDYDVLFAEVDSQDLHRLNQVLAGLPHTDTHATYRPHATIAYVKAGLADAYLATMPPVEEQGIAEAVTFSGPDRSTTTVPLAKGGATARPAVTKAVRSKLRALERAAVTKALRGG